MLLKSIQTLNSSCYSEDNFKENLSWNLNIELVTARRMMHGGNVINLVNFSV